jgi:hypothetical protein
VLPFPWIPQEPLDGEEGGDSEPSDEGGDSEPSEEGEEDPPEEAAPAVSKRPAAAKAKAKAKAEDAKAKAVVVSSQPQAKARGLCASDSYVCCLMTRTSLCRLLVLLMSWSTC